jgi:copper homeostasis protein (lipoprotein)
MTTKKLKARTLPLVVIVCGLGVLITSAQKMAQPAKTKMTVYQGVFPCADCSGLKTELTLYRNARTDAPETYRLRETYLGKPAGARTTVGKWTTLRGTPDNPDATIYQLNPDKPQEVRNFLVVNDNEIRQLDRELKEIESSLNFTLTRRNSSVPGGYSAIKVIDPDVKAAAEFALGEQSRRDGVHLSLMEIVQAQKQVVAGLNYKICLRARSGSTTRTAVAVIYKNLQQQYSLTSFQWGKCAITKSENPTMVRSP